MILALDSDFWRSCGTQLQEGNGGYIVSYVDVVVVVDYDDDDDVKAEIIPVITGALELSQDHLGNTLTTYQESMKSKKYNKRKRAVLDIAHVCNS
jgi:hypothetical protein